MSNSSAMAWRRSAPPKTAAGHGLCRKLPLVADVHFGKANMYEAMTLLCIADGAFVSQMTAAGYPRASLKTAREMQAQFADLPEAIETPSRSRAAALAGKRKPVLAVFGAVAGRSAEGELKVQGEEGLGRRLKGAPLAAERAVYDERLAYELGIINRMGFPGYFLIVSDFMKWTRAHGIPVGVRGSGASSLVAWALDITNLDPLRFGLFFERFLNPERLSMPDFDIDFCQERRDEVVRYVRDKYGADRVAQIMALGSLQARAAVRDAGRVLQMPLGLVDRIAKLIPNPPGREHFAARGGGQRSRACNRSRTERRCAQRLFRSPRRSRIFALPPPIPPGW
jgi:DNA polymerase-3 subunit alpha